MSGEPNVQTSHRAILTIALPIMVSNVTTPLIGVVDTAVVGRLPDPAHVGAVAVGSLVFSFLFWGFGFLRMGTTGLTAQSLGAKEHDEVRAHLARACLIAVVAGVALLGLSAPVRFISLRLIEGPADVEALAAQYIDARIFSAPATFLNFALLGWFVGLGRSGVALVLQLVLNLTNIGLDTLFVLEFGWGVRGVALGTVAAEWVAALIGLAIAAHHLRTVPGRFDWPRIKAIASVRRTLALNRDIMIRSLALVGVFVFFMSQGAKMGTVLLAANAVLFHFIDVSAYFLDGFAYAAEALTGRALGAGDREAFWKVARRSTAWAFAVSLLAGGAGILFGEYGIDAMIRSEAAREAAREYLAWAALSPIAGVLCFQLDGLFIGATRAPEMRNAMLASTAVFGLAWWGLQPWENHGLWAALYVFYAARTLTLGAYTPRLFSSHISTAVSP